MTVPNEVHDAKWVQQSAVASSFCDADIAGRRGCDTLELDKLRCSSWESSFRRHLDQDSRILSPHDVVARQAQDLALVLSLVLRGMERDFCDLG